MTLDQMRTRFYELYQETATDTDFPAATVTAWLNIGIGLMNMEALYNEKPLSLSTVNGTRTVNVPSDFIVTKDVYYTDGSSVKRELAPVRASVIQYDLSTASTPEFYSIRNSQLVFDPIPNLSSSTISGYYIGKETALSNDNDTPAMSDEFHIYPVHFAIYMACLSDGQSDRAKPHFEEFQEGTRRLAMRSYDDKVRRNFNMFVGWSFPGIQQFQQNQQG